LSFVSRGDFERIERLALPQNSGKVLGVLNDQAIAIMDIQRAQIKPVRVFNL
jgi:hypothetical protein